MEEIILENSADRVMAINGIINESQVRKMTVTAMPDTGARTLVINEEIRQKLGLLIDGECRSILADGTKRSFPLTRAVKIKWKNRSAEVQAVVAANGKTILLGALPLEAMDLVVDPVNQTLKGANGDQVEYLLC